MAYRADEKLYLHVSCKITLYIIYRFIKQIFTNLHNVMLIQNFTYLIFLFINLIQSYLQGVPKNMGRELSDELDIVFVMN